MLFNSSSGLFYTLPYGFGLNCFNHQEKMKNEERRVKNAKLDLLNSPEIIPGLFVDGL